MFRSSRFPAVLLVLAVLLEPAAAAGVKTPAAAEKPRAAIEPDACATAYHASLARIASEDLPLLRAIPPTGQAPATVAAAPADAAPSDASLPGQPLFVPPSRQRSAADIAALTAAVALARSKGRSASVAGAGSETERTWIAARLREDLGDYLKQKPTPFLCSGVPAYLETLRKFAARLGSAGDRRPEWIATQRLGAERSVRAAAEAIARALANAPRTVAQTKLRPAADLARNDAPADSPPPPALDDEAGMLATIDRFVDEVRTAGLAVEPPAPLVTGAVTRPLAVPSRPVLAKLLAMRPLVSSAHPAIRDRNVRLKLLAVFADLEMLDYLMQASAQAPDPAAAAIGRTLDRIAAARATDCTCRN